MRKELRRNGGAAGEVLGPRDRRDERSDVRNEAELALIKESLELRQVRMKSEVAAVAVLKREWQQRILRNRERAAGGSVGSIAAGIVRNDEIVGVVAAEEKETDQRFVIAGIERRGAEPAQVKIVFRFPWS